MKIIIDRFNGKEKYEQSYDIVGGKIKFPFGKIKLP